MKTIFAQAATFALSATGALAIIVGVIDQPQSPPAPPDTPSARRERPLRLPRRSAPWPDRLWCRGTLPLAPPRHQHHSDRVSIRRLVKMGIFSRTRDIIAAHVTDLLDRAEDPDKMIRQINLEINKTMVEEERKN